MTTVRIPVPGQADPWIDASARTAAGDNPNSASGGKAAGHNTDGFDCSTTDLTIEDRWALDLAQEHVLDPGTGIDDWSFV